MCAKSVAEQKGSLAKEKKKTVTGPPARPTLKETDLKKVNEKIDYNETVMDHFLNPRNAGDMENPDGAAMAGDPSCGDSMQVFLRIENDVITDVKFKVIGCAGAIASASMSTELIKGGTIEDALALTNDDVVKALNGLPAEKIHCSVMAEEAIVRAVDDYRQRTASAYYGQDHTYPFLFGDFGGGHKCICGREGAQP